MYGNSSTRKRVPQFASFFNKYNLVFFEARHIGWTLKKFDVKKFGNSNDGNTARRFFENPQLSAEITSIDVDLIKKIHVILIVVASGYEINVERFREYCHNTARYFVDKYSWYCMPPTIHKFLIHGPEVVESALLPIGQLTEEAQEACNKDFKRYREHNSRKCSRESSNRDVLNRFFLTSDPVITSKRDLPKKNFRQLTKEVSELLKPPTVEAIGDHNEIFENDDDDNNVDVEDTFFQDFGEEF